MTEQASPEGEKKESKEGKEGEQPNAPALDMEALKREVVTAAAAATKAELEKRKPQEVDVEKIQANATAAVQNKILEALGGGEKKKAELPELTRMLFADTEGTLGGLVEYAVQKALSESERRTEKAETFKSAVFELYQTRPDIARDPSAREYVGDVYDILASKNTEEKPPQELIKEATRRYDLHMERLGLGNAEKRISQAASVSPASVQGSAPQKAGKSAQEIDRESLLAEANRKRKLRGLPEIVRTD